MKTYLSRWASTLLVAGAVMGAGGAQAISVSQLPLFISTGATANVMLLMDNSGSMRNLVTDPGFDPTITYPDWSQNGDFYDASSGNLALSNLGSCGSGYRGGRRVIGGTSYFRCLLLPDPYGSSLTRVSGNYFNYLLETYGTNNASVDIRDIIPDRYRMQVARDVAANVVQSNTNLRFGVASFNSPSGSNGGPGGRIDATCGSSTNDVLAEIAGLQPDSNTPLAETYYEITRYFRGLSSYYNSGNHTSPITLRCQKSFVVAITDGFPTWDNTFPSNDSDGTLPDFDGLDPSTSASDSPLFPQYSDGYQNHGGGSQADEGYTLFLDDLAKFGFDTDLRDGGTDASGVSFNDSEFEQQNLVTYTVGFATANQMLEDAAEYGDGVYYTADNEDQLNTVLQSAFRDIQARISSAASVATNSAQLSSETLIFQARFNPGNWSGSLIAIEINNDGSLGDVSWDAANQMPNAGQRNIFTYNPSAPLGSRGREFKWGQLSNAQKNLLNKNVGGNDDGNGRDRLRYVRGNRKDEAPNGLEFRARGSVLGDIVNSDPYFVSNQDYGFDKLPGAEGAEYRTFRSSAAYSARPKMIYMGANDGMLHGFDAETGVERMAYIPNAVSSKLSALTDDSFNTNHQFLVDGSPRVIDARVNGAWESVLVGGLGAGGRGIFALRVTDPANFAVGDVLWEFTDAQDGDMGVAIPQASIARLNDGSWVAVVANGYNSGSGRAVLFLIDLSTGAVLKKFDTNVGGDNGLSSPIPVDVDGDRITDFIYAGDLKGNLWKFDVSDANANQWGVAFKQGNTPLPLFAACVTDNSSCPAGSRQAITARPEVGLNPGGGVVVYFGTGRYFATGDGSATSPINSFYALFDTHEKGENNPVPLGAGRESLREQEVVGTQTLENEEVRITTNNQPGVNDVGWYIDLPESGERQVSTPLLRGGRVIFTTLTPNGDPCGFGGTSWLMELDALSGSRLDVTPFDLNGDQRFDEDDFVEIDEEKIPVSGRRSKEGIIKTPGVIVGDGIEFKYASGSAGGVDVTVENNDGTTGRQSWRQIR